MSPEGNKALMARLENDMTDRMCGTGEYDSEIDLDRDMPNPIYIDSEEQKISQESLSIGGVNDEPQ